MRPLPHLSKPAAAGSKKARIICEPISFFWGNKYSPFNSVAPAAKTIPIKNVTTQNKTLIPPADALLPFSADTAASAKSARGTTGNVRSPVGQHSAL